jgi:hypothetical protein
VTTISPGFSLPVAKWPSNHALLQGFAYAKNPTDGREYLFVGKAESAGDGDLEDSFYHRHVWRGGAWVYLDTMQGKLFGHPQCFHVRISAAGNTWLWASVEQYSGTRKTGVKVARLSYRAGVVTTKDKSLTWMNTGTGSWQVLSTYTPPKTPARVVLRRGKTLTEVYEEHDEAKLRSGLNEPLRKFTRVKLPGTFQGAGASHKSVCTVQGSTSKTHNVYRYDWSARLAEKINVTPLKAATGPNTSSEPEGIGVIQGAWHVAKRFNSSARRQYETFKITF